MLRSRPSVSISGGTISKEKVQTIQFIIGAKKYAHIRPKAHIHMMAGLAPATNNDLCLACSTLAAACAACSPIIACASSAFIFAWPVLGEAITYQAIIGLVFVVSAILIMNRQPQ